MQTWITQIMQNYGYFGIALLIAIENLFPPIPSEVILTFGGFLTTYTTLNVWLVIFSATAGSLAGAIILYTVGLLVSPAQLQTILDGRLGRILHLTSNDVNRALSWFEKQGYKAVLFCRFIPMVRSIISIPAGFARMRMLPFLGLTTLGSFLWNTVLVWVGVAARESWDVIAGWLSSGSGIIRWLLFGGAVCFFIVSLIKNMQSRL